MRFVIIVAAVLAASIAHAQQQQQNQQPSAEQILAMEIANLHLQRAQLAAENAKLKAHIQELEMAAKKPKD